MPDDDWYRNTEWSPDIEEKFFERLGRARSQRDQYVVLQALTLVPNHPDVTLRLVDLYFESRKSDFDDVRALLARADARLALGQISVAVECYKAVLEREREFPNRRTNTQEDLPYLIAQQELVDEYTFALAVLEGGQEQPAFPLGRFKWYAASALIHEAKGEPMTAGEHARLALQEAQSTKSEFRYHSSLGLVDDSYKGMLVRLKTLNGRGHS